MSTPTPPPVVNAPDPAVVTVHKPVLGSSSLGVGFVGCACMGVREWYAYLAQHGGPGWLAWFEHVAAAQATALAQAQGPAREALALAAHLVSEVVGGRCEVADPGPTYPNDPPHLRGRCRDFTVAVRWEGGFADEVCEKHARSAEERGALVVRSRRHDGTIPALGSRDADEVPT